MESENQTQPRSLKRNQNLPCEYRAEKALCILLPIISFSIYFLSSPLLSGQSATLPCALEWFLNLFQIDDSTLQIIVSTNTISQFEA